jgi:hypothetical protein
MGSEKRRESGLEFRPFRPFRPFQLEFGMARRVMVLQDFLLVSV